MDFPKHSTPQFNIEEYLAMTPEQQRKHKERLLQETIERHNNIDAKWEEAQASMRANVQSGGGTNTSDQRKQELLKEIEAKGKESRKALNIASRIAADPGHSPKELKHAAETMVNDIRGSYGSGLADSFQALLEQSVRTAKGGSSTSRQTQTPTQEQIGPVVPTGYIEPGGETQGKSMKLKREREREDKGNSKQNKISTNTNEMSAFTSLLQRYRLHGWWYESDRLILSMNPEARLHPDIALQIAHNAFAQGTLRNAEVAVDSALDRWRNAWGDGWAIKALRLVRAYIRMLRYCRLQDNLDEALSILDINERAVSCLAPSKNEAIAEFWYQKIILVPIQEGLLDGSVFREIMIKRLETLERLLREARRPSEAIVFATQLHSFYDDTPPHIHSNLNYYLENPGISQIEKARFCMEVVSISSQSQEKDLTEELIDCAEKIFSNEGCPNGLLEVELERTKLRHHNARERVDEMLRIATEFDKLGSYSWEIRVLFEAHPVALTGFMRGEICSDIQLRLRSVCERIGSLYFQCMADSTIFTSLVARPEDMGIAFQGMRDLFNIIPSDMAKTKGQIATILGPLSVILGDKEKSLRYARSAVDILSQVASYESLSDANYCLAEVLMEGSSILDFEEATRILKDSMKLDEKHGYLQGQAKKASQLVSVEGRLDLEYTGFQKRYHELERDAWVMRSSLLDAKLSDATSVDAARMQLAGKNFKVAAQMAKDISRRLEGTEKLLEAAQCQDLIFSCYHRSFDFSAYVRGESQWITIDDMVHQARRALAAYDKTGRENASIAFFIAVAFAFEEIGQYDTSRMYELSQDALQYLNIAKMICEKTRRGLPYQAGLGSFLQKRIFVGYQWNQDIVRRALRISLNIVDPQALWIWTQRKKAHALSDMVASQLVTVTNVQAELKVEAQKDYRTSASSSPEGQSPVETMVARFAQLRGSAERHSVLVQILSERGYQIQATKDIAWIFDSEVSTLLPTDAKIVLVDWITIEGRIVMLTINETLIPEFETLDTTVYEIETWKRKHLHLKEPFNSKSTALDELGEFVFHLTKKSERGDLLVLCPSHALNGIPLHALKTSQDHCLIDRNPVIYTPSLSLLRQCCEKVTIRSKQQFGPVRVAFISDLQDHDSKIEPIERGEVFKSIHGLAVSFSAEKALDRDATRERFQKLATDTDLLHFHGHMQFAHPNVLYQGLQLNGGHAAQDAATDTRNHIEILTVRDIFAMEIGASLVDIIACRSGYQDVDISDEPLGLFTALLYAGAATIVGTLWPLDSQDGRRFSELFLSTLRKQLEKDVAKPFLNLAIAYQRAVNAVRFKDKYKEQTPYHWAGFAIMGCPFLFKHSSIVA